MSFLRPSLRLLAAHPAAVPATLPARTRLSTTLTGLSVHPAPLPHLLSTYRATLSLLNAFPAAALYRRSVESITQERIALIEQHGMDGTEESINKVETEIGLGCIEEIIVMAEDEHKLAGQMLGWKAYVRVLPHGLAGGMVLI